LGLPVYFAFDYTHSMSHSTFMCSVPQNTKYTNKLNRYQTLVQSAVQRRHPRDNDNLAVQGEPKK